MYVGSGKGEVVNRRRLWLRLVFFNVVLLATLMVFVWFESWLVGMNVNFEGVFTRTLEMVVSGAGVVFISVVAATAAVGVAGVVYAWSAERNPWPFVALGLVFLVFAVVIFRARPGPELRERALSTRPPDLKQLLR